MSPKTRGGTRLLLESESVVVDFIFVVVIKF